MIGYLREPGPAGEQGTGRELVGSYFFHLSLWPSQICSVYLNTGVTGTGICKGRRGLEA